MLFDFPPGVIAMSGPAQSGGCHVSLRGAGQNVTVLLVKPGGAGLWRHGSAEAPALGYFQLQDLSLVDGNPNGSGAVGLAIRFGAEAPQSAMTWQGVALRKWTRPATVTNCPRNWHCENVTIFGPDFTMQEGAGVDIASTADFAQGCFTYVFINVMVANYAWGWRYDIQAPLEGQRFVSCTCYNGWGMIQAYCHGGTGPGQATAGYKSVLWSLVDCDWQGLGFGLDLVNLRQVSVTRGFFIANPNTDKRPVPPAPGETAPRERRRYFSFLGCTDVVLRDVKLDVLQNGIEPSLALVFADAACEMVRAFNTNVFSFAPIHAAFEFGTPAAPVRLPATMGEFDTEWQAWAGGAKTLDPGGRQIEQSVLRERGLGEVDAGGRVTLETTTAPLPVQADGRIAVTFRRRAGGQPYFSAPPVLSVAPLGAGPWALVAKSAEGFSITVASLRAGTPVQIDYRASGR